MPILLSLQTLWADVKATTGGLLRFLLLWICALPSNSGGRRSYRMLRQPAYTMSKNDKLTLTVIEASMADWISVFLGSEYRLEMDL